LDSFTAIVLYYTKRCNENRRKQASMDTNFTVFHLVLKLELGSKVEILYG
jgi:hypothetical protein